MNTPNEPVSGGSLKKRAVRSGAWSVGGNMFSQILRFGSNAILTYLLLPEALGLMLMIDVCLQGLQMFSDVGIGPSLIQSKRGEEPRFVNTAWTMQVIRGFALWGVACLVAWPVSLLGEGFEPLVYLLPVAGVNAAIAGFNSTAIFTLSRRLTISKVIFLDLTAQVIGMIAMIGWALQWQSVWALVGGGIVTITVRMLISHRLAANVRNRFAWDREASGELFRFGRWIFVSTIFTFLGRHVDKLMLGAIMGPAMLGIFGVGQKLARQAPNMVRKMAQGVGFPAMSELYRKDEANFRHRLTQIRLILILSHNAVQLVLVLFGPWVVAVVYDSKYHNAGWMLAALATSSVAGIVNSTYGNAFMAMGKTFNVMAGVISQLIVVVAASLIGYYFAGKTGYIYGLATVQWALYPVYTVMAIRAGIWQPRIDLPVLIVGGGICSVVLFG